MSQKIPLAGVLGHPIGHSKSPRLHSHWLKTLGLPGHYIPMDVAPQDLPDAFSMLPKLGFRGVNVTVPHKEAALALAEVLTDRARAVGAVNTVTFSDQGVEGDNTDGIGFIENLRQYNPNWTGASGPAAVLGAGGASRAVIVALLEAGAPEIRLANRTQARADALAELFGDRVIVVPWAEAPAMFADVSTAVNTTSLGMSGQPAFDIPLDDLPATALATDLVYTPLQTPFLIAARARGCETADGLGMLLHQGVPGFSRWFGQTPVVTDELRAAVLSP